MISGNQERTIKEYLPKDRCCEGHGYIKPLDGQEFIGIPYGWLSDNSTPFIEIRQNGKTIGTINCDDISEIIFEIKETLP